jgi:hypothetical protein
MMMRRSRWVVVACGVALCLTSTANAQKADSSRVGIEPRHSEHAFTPRANFSREAADSLSSDSGGGLKYPLIGALIGAGVGLAAGLVVMGGDGDNGNSNEGLAYLIFVPGGALIGFTAGFVAYLARRH